jgi:hypothetical protein
LVMAEGWSSRWLYFLNANHIIYHICGYYKCDNSLNAPKKNSIQWL